VFKRHFVVSIFLSVIAVFNVAAGETKSVKFLDGLVQISVPAALGPMPEELKRLKYPVGNPPREVFSDEDGAVNVAANRTAFPKGGNLDETAVESSATTIGRIRNITAWHFKGLRDIGGRRFGVLEFTGKAIDTDVYSYIYFTQVDDTLVLLTVNSTVNKLPEWKAALMDAVASTRITD
jgi:hypothetical protein